MRGARRQAQQAEVATHWGAVEQAGRDARARQAVADGDVRPPDGIQTAFGPNSYRQSHPCVVSASRPPVDVHEEAVLALTTEDALAL